jgi:hypothetical protein
MRVTIIKNCIINPISKVESTYIIVAFTALIMTLSVRRIAWVTTQGAPDEVLVEGGASGGKQLTRRRRDGV